MSKIKEKLLNDNSFLEDAINDHLDDEYHYDKSKQVTMEEVIKNHDDWWNSLTEEEKQKIADEHKEAEDYFNKNR
tara:strand:- start:441 stop:665 length:225 start_codon:yes stop_codon:yes gene_type:complete